MIKFIHCADIHLGRVQNNLEQRFIDFGTAFSYVVETAVAKQVDFFLISGDLFDKRNINARTLEQAVEILEPLKDLEIPVIAIEGNHDKAFLRDKDSWMSFLANRGYITLLSPRFESGKMLIEPYNQAESSGCYIDLPGDIRIYGLGYLGRSAGSKLTELAEILSEEKINIILLHAMVGRMGGELIGSIPKSDVLPLKGKVTYLALGHGHNCYVVDKQGETTPQSISSLNEAAVTAENSTAQSDERTQLSLFDLLASEANGTAEVVPSLDSKVEQVFLEVENYHQSWGHNPGAVEHCRLDEAEHKQGFFYGELIGRELTKVEHIQSKQRPAKVVVADITGTAEPEEAYAVILSRIREKTAGLANLLLRLIIKGEIGFDILEIDEEHIREEIAKICEPLILEVDLRANLPTTHTGRAEMLDRQSIEREVLRKKVEGRAAWRHLGDTLVDLILEVREDLLAGTRPEEILHKVLEMAGEENEDS